jgi:hypothetical protein
MNLSLGFGLNKFRNGALLNQIPFKSDALFWLDGTILDFEGTKYFVDKSGNDRNFTITNYDITATNGFPYKSKSTISAPVADAVLIAADLNNFLYASDGTPNQIPIVSLFQDVDYEHKLFCRHAEQQVDAGLVETYEARVLDIVMYSTVKANADLTECQSFFSVPVEVTTNVLWVSKLGNDTTGNGSKVNPYLTIRKAAVNNRTVYIKSGVYSENHNASASGYCLINSSTTFVGIGRVEVSSQASAAQIFGILDTKVCNFKGLYVNDAVRKFGFNFLGTTARAGSVEKCFVNNATKPIIGTAISYKLINSILDGNSFCETGKFSETIQSCNFNVSILTGGGTGNVFKCHNSKIVGFSTASGSFSLIEMIGNISTLSLFSINSTQNGGSLVFFANKLVTSITHNLGVLDSVSITDNIITSTGLDIDVTVSVAESVTIERNILLAYTDKFAKIAVNKGVTATTVSIKHNYIESKNLGDPAIAVGNESNVSYNTITGTIEGNRVKMIRDFVPTALPTSHSIVVFNNSQVDIISNYISGGGLGTVYKTKSLDSTGKKVAYNLIENCSNGLVNKGVCNLMISNNTVLNCYKEGANIIDNETDVATGNIFKNNIIVDLLSASAAYNHLIKSATGETTINNNRYYSANNATPYNAGGADINFAAWQALGFDADSLESNPNLTNFIPTPVVTGENLGEDYKTGLDITTTWGSATTLPVIVAKQQAATWQKGAYIQ